MSEFHTLWPDVAGPLSFHRRRRHDSLMTVSHSAGFVFGFPVSVEAHAAEDREG